MSNKANKEIAGVLVVEDEKDIAGVTFQFIRNVWVASVGGIPMVMEKQDDGTHVLGLWSLSKESLDLVIRFVQNLGDKEDE